MDNLQTIIDQIDAEKANLKGRLCDNITGIITGLEMARKIVKLQMNKPPHWDQHPVKYGKTGKDAMKGFFNQEGRRVRPDNIDDLEFKKRRVPASPDQLIGAISDENCSTGTRRKRVLKGGVK